MSLHNLRVLVTRPKPQGEELCQEIRSAGGIPVYFPVIEIKPPQDSDALQEQIKQIDQFDWIIFVSPQAVMQSLPFIRDHWPVLPVTVKIATIGSRTAMLLEKAGISVAAVPPQDWRSEGLLRLSEFQQVDHKKIAVFCAAGGRDLLVDTLRQRGAIVTLVMAYQRCLPVIDASETIQLIHSRAIDVIISTSHESLRNMIALLGQENVSYLMNLPLIVVSERIAMYARELGFNQVMLAENASHPCILAALRKLYGK